MTAYAHEARFDPDVVARSLQDAERDVFWLDDPDRPEARPSLTGDAETDLLVVGGGYAGLWTALLAKERDPDRRVILVEGRRLGGAASGRNGGFVETTLTHGPDNAALHFADDLEVLDRLGAENFAAIPAALERYGIDAEYEHTGMLTVATEPHQIASVQGWADEAEGSSYLDADGVRRYIRSPVARGGLFESRGVALVHPAKLAWGLARTAESLGVEVHENTPVLGIRSAGQRVIARTAAGSITADRVALATNGFPSLLRRLRMFTVPIYDYVLMTEPLSLAQLEQIGWTGRHGITDAGREFHYYRKTRDDRILFGGYDAVYHRGGRVRDAQTQRDESFERLADHFFTTFPQLAGTRFTHRWGGMIDMSTQLVAFHGAAMSGRVAYSAGYTGLGVAATRFGAEVMLDLLAGEDTERTRLKVSRRLPIPVPPEPFAYPLIQTMRHAVARSDRNGGRDGPLLRLAGLFGVGFDS